MEDQLEAVGEDYWTKTGLEFVDTELEVNFPGLPIRD